jgi:hypothetical protein
MGARVHGRKAAHHHVPEDADDGELALLVEEGVVGEDGEVDDQERLRCRWPEGPL